MARGNKVSITEAAQLLNIGRQAVFQAVKHNRMHAEADANGMFWIEIEEVEKYEKSRWKRSETTRFNGKKIFQENSEYISARDAGAALGLTRQQMYYATRRRILKPKARAGNMLVFDKTEIEAFKAELHKYNFWVATA